VQDFFSSQDCSVSGFQSRVVTPLTNGNTCNAAVCTDNGSGQYVITSCTTDQTLLQYTVALQNTYGSTFGQQAVATVTQTARCASVTKITFTYASQCVSGVILSCNNNGTITRTTDTGCQGTSRSTTIVYPSACYSVQGGSSVQYVCAQIGTPVETVYADAQCQTIQSISYLTSQQCLVTSNNGPCSAQGCVTLPSDPDTTITFRAFRETIYSSSNECFYSLDSLLQANLTYYNLDAQTCNSDGSSSFLYACQERGINFPEAKINTYNNPSCSGDATPEDLSCSGPPPAIGSCVNTPRYSSFVTRYSASDCSGFPYIAQADVSYGICDQSPNPSQCQDQSGIGAITTCSNSTDITSYDSVASNSLGNSYLVGRFYSSSDCSDPIRFIYIQLGACVNYGSFLRVSCSSNGTAIINNYKTSDCSDVPQQQIAQSGVCDDGYQVDCLFAPPITSSALTTAPLTTAGITSAALTTSPLTTAEITSSALTTSKLTTSAITSAALTTAEITSSALTTAEITSQALTTQEMTSNGLTTQEITSNGITTSALTTMEITSSEITSASLTSSFLTSSAVTSARLTTSRRATGLAALTTTPISTTASTTPASNLSQATSLFCITSVMTMIIAMIFIL